MAFFSQAIPFRTPEGLHPAQGADTCSNTACLTIQNILFTSEPHNLSSVYSINEMDTDTLLVCELYALSLHGGQAPGKDQDETYPGDKEQLWQPHIIVHMTVINSF